MADEVRIFAGIQIFGGYFFQGCDEIKAASGGDTDPARELTYKITYENGHMTKIEMQRSGVTADTFSSMPAIINYEFSPGSITVYFRDEQNTRKVYRNIDLCVMKADGNQARYSARFFVDGKRVADEAGMYEIVLNFSDSTLQQILEERYFDVEGRPLEIQSIDWKGVECGSPGPEAFYYYSAARYVYDEANTLERIEYLNSVGAVVHRRPGR